VRKPKMTEETAAATKSSEPRNPEERIGGVEILHSGLKTLNVLATIPPPEAERAPSRIWYIKDPRMAGFEWEVVARTAPEMGNDRVRASMTGTTVSRVSALGWYGVIKGELTKR
jgi:hypothetical protein